MKIILIILLCSIVSSLRAETFSYKSPTLSYNLTLENSKILVEMKDYKLEIVPSQCNFLLFKSFHKKIKNKLQRKVLRKTTRYKLIQDRKIYFLEENSNLQVYLSKIKSQISAFQLKTKAVCD